MNIVEFDTNRNTPEDILNCLDDLTILAEENNIKSFACTYITFDGQNYTFSTPNNDVYELLGAIKVLEADYIKQRIESE